MYLPTADIAEIYNNYPDLKKSDVDALMDWSSKQPHLPRISELQIIIFLQSCYYSNELAKTTIDNFFTIRTICADIVGNRNPKHPCVQSASTCTYVCPLPQLTPPPHNYSVVFMKLLDCKPENFNFAHQMNRFDMIQMLQLHQHGPQHGLVMAFDMKGAVFGHLARLSPMLMKRLLYYLQEAMPVRLKEIHFINVVPFMDLILAMMRPFAKKELIGMLHLHESLESFCKFVPQECLPAEYGGKAAPLNILLEKVNNDINDNAEYFQFEENQVVDESKRPGKPKNVCDFFGMEGTFKKLEVD